MGTRVSYQTDTSGIVHQSYYDLLFQGNNVSTYGRFYASRMAMGLGAAWIMWYQFKYNRNVSVIYVMLKLNAIVSVVLSSCHFTSHLLTLR